MVGYYLNILLLAKFDPTALPDTLLFLLSSTLIREKGEFIVCAHYLLH